MKLKLTIFAILFAILLSTPIIFIYILVGQLVLGMGGVSIFAEPEIYISTIPSFSIVFVAVAFYFSRHRQISEKKLWVMSAFVSFSILLLSTTVFDLLVGYLTGIIMIGTSFWEHHVRYVFGELFLWGVITTFILTPVFTPVARIVLAFFRHFLSKFNVIAQAG